MPQYTRRVYHNIIFMHHILLSINTIIIILQLPILGITIYGGRHTIILYNE